MLFTRTSLFFAIANLPLLSFGSPVKRDASTPGPKCHDFFMPMNVTSQNRRINDTVLSNTTSVDEMIAYLNESNRTYSDVTQSVNVSARFCEPEVKIYGRENHIQLLIHGITYTKTYWSALGFPGYQPEHYSYIHYASMNGYPTLSIDRPGVGLSSRPDPFWQDQIPFQAAVIKKIADRLKAEGRKVIYVGHSLGSNIANYLAAHYPDSVNAMVLTGFSGSVSQVLVGAAIPTVASSFSSRFSGLSSGYLVTSRNSGRQLAMYGRNGTYDPLLADLDFSTQDTVAIGEMGTEGFPIAKNYDKPVTIVTGEQDSVFCYVNTTVDGDCGFGDDSTPAKARKLFPNASVFGYYIVNETGHDINLHYRAPEAFAYIHSWLSIQGF